MIYAEVRLRMNLYERLQKRMVDMFYSSLYHLYHLLCNSHAGFDIMLITYYKYMRWDSNPAWLMTCKKEWPLVKGSSPLLSAGTPVAYTNTN